MEKLDIKLTFLDRTIGYFSPRALLKRKKAKVHNAYFTRKYEGADAGRRTKGWNTASLSANAEIESAGFRMRDRARDLVRNNPYAAEGLQVISEIVVGAGIKTQIKIDTRASISNKEKKINSIWKAWAGTTACDFDGLHTFSGMQDLIMRAVAESGEVLVRRRRTRRRTAFGPDGKQVELPPIQLQVLEADFISSESIGLTDVAKGNFVSQGIEFDPQGKRVAYHLHKSHPGNNNVDLQSSFDTIRVPASEIQHVYRVDRPGQMRGTTFFHPVILRLKDFDLYEDAQLKRQQCAAMFTAFVTDIEGMDEDAEKVEQVELGEKMEPGLIEILAPGKSIVLSDPPGADNYKEYTSGVLHAIGTGLGITYESLTGDFSEVNFSSGRMGFIKMDKNAKSWRSKIIITQVLDPTFEWFKEGLALIGESADNARAVHTPPRREMIDPVKETQAIRTAIRSGLKTQSEAVRELGKDPDAHFAEYAQDNKLMDDLGLIFDSDPRKRDNSGSEIDDDEKVEKTESKDN